MSNEKPPLLVQLIDMIRQSSEMTVNSTRTLTEESMRFRAWESMLYMLFARYYLARQEPLELARTDKEFLANSWQQHGNDPDMAARVEKIYQTIETLMEQHLRWRAEQKKHSRR